MCSTFFKPITKHYYLLKSHVECPSDLFRFSFRSSLCVQDSHRYHLPMQNMYEDGDDEMKKTIAKAWTDARTGKAAPGSSPSGMDL